MVDLSINRHSKFRGGHDTIAIISLAVSREISNILIEQAKRGSEKLTVDADTHALARTKPQSQRSNENMRYKPTSLASTGTSGMMVGIPLKAALKLGCAKLKRQVENK